MECRRFLDELTRARAADALSVDLQHHAEACPTCALELRARRLLGLGSRLSEQAPRAGFSARLRARLAAERSQADWPEAIGLVVRPAFGLAAAVLLLAVGVYSAVPSPAARDDLALLAERDPNVSALLSGLPIELLAPPER